MNSQETWPKSRAGMGTAAGASPIASNVVPARCWPGWVELGKWGDFTQGEICRHRVCGAEGPRERCRRRELWKGF